MPRHLRSIASAGCAAVLWLCPADARAAPVTLIEQRYRQLVFSERVVGTVPDIDALYLHAGPFDPPPLVLVDGFDASLGTLLSARLTIDAVMVSMVLDHSLANSSIGPAYFKDSGRAHWSVPAFETLDEIIQASANPGFTLVDLFQTYSEVEGEDKKLLPFQTEYVESQRTHSSQMSFDQLFTGGALNFFIDVGTIGYFDDSVWFDGSHTGLLGGNAVSAFLAPPTEMQPGTKPGIASAVIEAARLLDEASVESDGHELQFSDMHIAIVRQVGLRVEYVYEPVTTGLPSDPTAVPEPTTMTLTLLGLGWVSRKTKTSARRS